MPVNWVYRDNGNVYNKLLKEYLGITNPLTVTWRNLSSKHNCKVAWSLNTIRPNCVLSRSKRNRLIHAQLASWLPLPRYFWRAKNIRPKCEIWGWNQILGKTGILRSLAVRNLQQSVGNLQRLSKNWNLIMSRLFFLPMTLTITNIGRVHLDVRESKSDKSDRCTCAFL